MGKMTTTRFTTIVLLLAGLFFLIPGIWAFVAPHSGVLPNSPVGVLR